MQLYLVQHGRSKSKEEDPDRPLTEQGAAETRQTASFIGEQAGTQAQRILHSVKTRAVQTAQIMADYLKPQSGVEAVAGLSPMDDPVIWTRRLKTTTEDLMLVGHLPHLSRLASLLICGDAENKVVDFKNSGVVSLVRIDGDWMVRWIVLPLQ